MTAQKNVRSSFTLIELLLVVAVIAIMAGLVVQVLRPQKYLADSRNVRRKIDVHSISLAIYQYRINKSAAPAGIPKTLTEICKSSASSCGNLVNLNVLADKQEFLSNIPTDPLFAENPISTGYGIYENENARIVVSAPYAENNEIIEEIR